MSRYSVVSLFSGAMGLDIGLERTNRFAVRAVVEKEKPFCDTIRTNRAAGRIDPNVAIFEGDITTFDPAAVLAAAGLRPGELDLLVGGPPCQSFSTAGKRQSTEDVRGLLLWEFLRFVDYMQPRFFLIENVRGLLSAALKHRPIKERPERGGSALMPDEEPGSVIKRFAADLQEIGAGYHLDCFEVNAVNYGAPQLRERVLMIGNRYNVQVDFPSPTHGNPADQETFRGKLKPWRTLRDALRGMNDPGGVILDFSPRKKHFLSKVPSGSNWRSLPTDIQKASMGKAWLAKGGRSGWWRRLSFDLPCPTLVTMPNHASTALCHPTEVRALTLKEYAAIQEFPYEWQFCGTPAEQYAQVGNAVPVRLGIVAGEVIAEALAQLQTRGMRPFKKSPLSYRIVYIQSHVRTRQWFKAGKVKVWSDGLKNDDASYAEPVTRRRERLLQYG
jgi:DNA (cytosine-5)-methyltransferase 1